LNRLGFYLSFWLFGDVRGLRWLLLFELLPEACRFDTLELCLPFLFHFDPEVFVSLVSLLEHLNSTIGLLECLHDILLGLSHHEVHQLDLLCQGFPMLAKCVLFRVRKTNL
jgi:hypothetical protein